MKVKQSQAILISIFLFCVSSSLSAATATTTFTVTATVSSACLVAVPLPLSFGTFNPIAGVNVDQTNTLNVTCTSGTTYNVGLDAGAGSSATVANRLMTRTTGGAQTIAYTIYTDTGRTSIWGNTIGTNTQTGTGTGSAQPFTMYGRIFSTNLTTIPPASYLDTVTATVTF